jgi:glycosyltransferase involved in cell wall biosynthesis
MADVLLGHGIRDNIKLWPRGIETSRFRPQNRSVAWRRSHGIDDDEVVVLFVSRLVWEKGLEALASTLHHLRNRGVRHRALVVGSGPAYEEFRAATPPDALMLGHLEGQDLAAAYASSDVFFFPSHTETFGDVTLEAMASGLPVVCADAPGSASIVLDHRTGYLCPVGDAKAFSVALEKLINDGALRRGMGDAAYEEAQKYDWNAALSQIDSYYDEVLGTRPVPARRLRLRRQPGVPTG